MVQRVPASSTVGKLNVFPIQMTKNETRNTEVQKPVLAVDEDLQIAIELVRARKALSWSQNELHLKSGVSRESIKQYETGRNKPGAREIRLLCEALGISPNRLLLGRDETDVTPSLLKSLVNNPEVDYAKQIFRLQTIFGLLTTEERDALLTLIEPILIARKGEKQLRELFAGFDKYTFIVTQEGAHLPGGFKEFLREKGREDGPASQEDLNEFFGKSGKPK